jgi:hypothetical protein
MTDNVQKIPPKPQPSDETARQIALAREAMRRWRNVLRELAKH